MHHHYCSCSVLQVMMLHLHSASSKLLCSNALYNTSRGALTRLHWELYKLFKENFADVRISFLTKARQEHRELRSLLVTKNYVTPSYLRFCVCASETFVFIVISLGVCVCVCVFFFVCFSFVFFSVGLGNYYSQYFRWNVCYSLSCSFVT